MPVGRMFNPTMTDGGVASYVERRGTGSDNALRRPGSMQDGATQLRHEVITEEELRTGGRTKLQIPVRRLSPSIQLQTGAGRENNTDEARRDRTAWVRQNPCCR